MIIPPTYRQEIVVFKRTTDDWCGNYKVADDCRVRDLVEISFMAVFVSGTRTVNGWLVCAWGNDDLGIEKYFELAEKDAALAIFLEIISQEDVTQDFLYEKGFERG